MKSSGKSFEDRIEAIILSTKKFGNSVFHHPFILNILSYKELVNGHPSLDFETIIKRSKYDIFLIKNFPTGNNLREKTEFCIVLKTNNGIVLCRIECKYQKVNGSTHKKLEHEFAEHVKANFNNSNPTYFILIYDGKYYEEKQFIIDEKQNDIVSDNTSLLLNVEEFKTFLFDFLTDKNFQRAFKAQKNL